MPVNVVFAEPKSYVTAKSLPPGVLFSTKSYPDNIWLRLDVGACSLHTEGIPYYYVEEHELGMTDKLKVLVRNNAALTITSE